MVFIRIKHNVYGSYRYLVKQYQDPTTGRQRQIQKYLGVAPPLAEDAPKGVVLFAGGGGVECGMIAAGIRPVLSVEHDPGKPELSKAIADINHLNFKPYGTYLLKKRVEEVVDTYFFSNFAKCDYLHASPVCSNFSVAKKGKKEAREDIESAIAVCQAIQILQPGCFILENVPKYINSDSWYLVKQTLQEEGYNLVAVVLDATDYGVPQSRKRLIVKATRLSNPTLPIKSKPVSWYEAIADLIADLPDSDLLPAQQKLVDKRRSLQPGISALLVERNGYRDGIPKVREPVEPCWTIKRSIFTDQCDNNRSRFIDVWLADGTKAGRVKALTIEAVARLQTFPNWYYLPEKISVAGSILGYSVPPLMMQRILQSDIAIECK